MAKRGSDVDLLGVVFGGEEVFDFVGVAEANAVEPALALRDFVDGAGLGLERVVDLGDLAADRRVQVASGLDGLDHAASVARAQVRADLGQLDEREVSQLLLGVVGYADDGGVSLDTNPFV